MNKSSNIKVKKIQDLKSNVNINSSMKNEAGSIKDDTALATEEAKKKRESPLKAFGIMCSLLALFSLLTSMQFSIEETPEIQNAITEKVSTSLSIGSILLSEDDDATPQDYTITHTSNEKESKIWVWDYAAEDGDYVQIFVDGIALGDAFMIKHKPVQLMVPVEAEITVKGVKDGGGGITYAVRYDLNSTTYFNAAPVGDVNTYTLIKK